MKPLHEPAKPTPLQHVSVRTVGNPWIEDHYIVARRQAWLERHPGERIDNKLALVEVTHLEHSSPEVLVCESDWAFSQVGHEAAETESDALLIQDVGGVRFLVPNTAVVHVCLLTSDHVALLARRHEHLRYYPGRWSATYEEGVEPSDTHGPSANPLTAAVLRGSREEFGHAVSATIAAEEVEYAGLIFEDNLANPAVLCIAKSSASYGQVIGMALPSPSEVTVEGLDGYDLKDLIDSTRSLLVTRLGRTLTEDDLHPTTFPRLQACQRSLS